MDEKPYVIHAPCRDGPREEYEYYLKHSAIPSCRQHDNNTNDSKSSLQHASDDEKNDKAYVMEAVRREGYDLEHASYALRNDPEVVIQAAKHRPMAIKFATQHLQNDRTFFLKAIKEADGAVLCRAQFDFTDDKEMVLAAMENSKFIGLSHVSKRLCDDFDVVLASVKNRGYTYNYASNRLRTNRDIILAAVSNDGYVVTDIPYSIRKFDKDVVIAASRTFSIAYSFASREIRDDKAVALRVMSYHGNMLYFSSNRLADDLDVVLAAIRSKKKPCDFSDISERLQADPYLQKLHHWRCSLRTKLFRWMVDRHRQLQASKVAAQVDLWLINEHNKKGSDPLGSGPAFSPHKKQRHC
jgi:hypothetical protein